MKKSCRKVAALFFSVDWAHILAPVQVPCSQAQYHGLCSSDVGRDGNVVTVADPRDREDVGFIGAVHERVVKEDDQVKVAALDHVDKLLFPSDTSGQEFMDFQVGYFLDPPAGHFSRIELMPGQDIFVSKTEILDQAFFAVVCDKAYVHKGSSKQVQNLSLDRWDDSNNQSYYTQKHLK